MAQKKISKSFKSKTKKDVWFTAVRGSYLPASWQGWFSYIPFVAYLLFTLFTGWANTNSTALAILFVAPNWIAATVVMTWVAKRMS
jgi:membrane-anchored protein YejM (alkaline phosphatase superfamily)